MEEVVKVDNLSRTERGILYRLKCEPALFNRFTKEHVAAAVFLRDLVHVEGQIFTAEQMLKLNWLTISKLGARQLIKLILIVVFLDLSLLGVLFEQRIYENKPDLTDTFLTDKFLTVSDLKNFMAWRGVSGSDDIEWAGLGLVAAYRFTKNPVFLDKEYEWNGARGCK